MVSCFAGLLFSFGCLDICPCEANLFVIDYLSGKIIRDCVAIMKEKSKKLAANWPQAISPYAALAATSQRLASLIQTNAKDVFRTHGLTFAQFDALAALRSFHQSEPVTPTALYETLLITSGGLTKVLKSLENQGFIARPPSVDDARQRPVLLTSAGREKVEQVIAELIEKDRLLLKDAFENEEDCMKLADRMQDIIASIEDTLRTINSSSR